MSLPVNLPPVVNGSATLLVIVGVEVTYSFTVVDMEDDVVNVTWIGDPPENAVLTRNNQIYQFNFTLDSPTGFSLSFVANDSLGATTLLDPQVQICGCQNASTCDLEGLPNPSADPVIMACDCSDGKPANVITQLGNSPVALFE